MTTERTETSPDQHIHRIILKEFPKENPRELRILSQTTFSTITQNGFVSTCEDYIENGEHRLWKGLFRDNKERLNRVFKQICLTYLCQHIKSYRDYRHQPK